MRSRGLAAISVLGIALGASPAARAVPPIAVDTVPCVSIPLAERSVLVQASARVSWPADARPVGRLAALDVDVLLLPSRERAREVAGLLTVAPGVRWAAVDSRVSAQRTPNDPLVPRQWAMRVVRVQSAWDVETGRRNPVVVAVLDTGVDASHPDLIGHVRAGGDFVSGDADPSDEHFHGTAVSGVVAASTNNKKGVAGISWGATVLAERVLNAAGSGSMCTVAAGIIDAVDAGARVLNLSLGAAGDGCPFVMEQALGYARDHDALVVVSAGNDGARGNPVNYPAGCDGAFAVSATDTQDKPAKFSEYGPQVDISAPGVNVVTTSRDDDGVHGYAYLSGTSISAPIVAGAAALLLSRHPDWTAEQVRARLVATARDLGPRGRDDRYGAGRVDIGRALR
ncbi:MAG: S8 family serine peptidase [Frankiaceae bacterium]|nr:S8 family serine peptidase [Frankiaceae bacterium]